MIVDELIALLGYDIKGEHELRQFNDGLDRAERKAQAVANRINAMSVAVGAFVGQVAFQFANRISSVIGSLPGDVLAVGKEFENLGIRFETLEGSAEKGREALEWVRKFAIDTPLDLAQAANAYARLRNFGIDPTNGSLLALVDAMAASGQGLQMLERLTLAVGQAWAKGKLQGEEILQLVEAGIPVWEMLEEATGKSAAELQKLASAGQLGRDVIQQLIDEIGKRYVGASEKMAQTLDGIQGKITEVWTNFKKEVADRGFYEEFKRRAQEVLDTLEGWEKSGAFGAAAQAISNFLTGSMAIGERVGRVIWDIGRAAFYAAKGMVELISKITGLNTAASAGVLGAAVLGSTPTGRAALAFLARRIPALAAFVVVEDILSALRGDESYIGKLEGGQEAIDKLSESFRKLAEAIAAIEPAWQSMMELDFLQFINQSLLQFINDLSRALREFAIIARAIAQGDWRLAGSMLLFGADEEKLDRIEEYQRQRDRPDTTNDRVTVPEQSHPEEAAPVDGMDAPRSSKGGRVTVPRPEQPQSGQAAPVDGMDVPRSSGKGGRVTAPRPERFQSGEVAPVDGLDALRTALENYQANVAKLGASTNAVVEDNRVQTDARNQSINVGSPNVTVNVQEATQAPAAVGQAVGRAVGQAAVPPRAQLNTEPSF